MKETFRFDGKRYEYIQQLKPIELGIEHIGERTIEIPIATEWYNAVGVPPSYYNVCEVGAVTPYWIGAKFIGEQHRPVPVRHDVYDPFDPFVKCIKQDAEEVDFTDMSVLCISTLEHMGRAEYGSMNFDEEKPIRVLNKIIEQATHYFITVPQGWHAGLDDAIAQLSGVKFMKQIEENNRWRQSEPDRSIKYNSPFRYANLLSLLIK